MWRIEDYKQSHCCSPYLEQGVYFTPKLSYSCAWRIYRKVLWICFNFCAIFTLNCLRKGPFHLKHKTINPNHNPLTLTRVKIYTPDVERENPCCDLWQYVQVLLNSGALIVTLTAITALQLQLSALCQHGAVTKRMGHSRAAAAVISSDYWLVTRKTHSYHK